MLLVATVDDTLQGHFGVLFMQSTGSSAFRSYSEENGAAQTET